MPKYLILESTQPGTLEMLVRSHLKKGYKTTGSLCVVVIANKCQFFQSMELI